MPRLFVAFPVPSMVPLELLRKFNAYDLATAKTFHLTLKFLGDVDAGRIPELIERLQRVQMPPTTFSFGKLGTFADFDGRPRVLWIALQPEEPLIKLHVAIEHALQGLFSCDKNYQPHLTLGRFRSEKHLSSLPSVLKMTPPAFTSLIKEFSLYKSEQQSDGPYQHTVLATFPLHS